MIALELDQETETLLREVASKRGLTAEQYAMMVLEVLIKTRTESSEQEIPFYLTATDEEWEKQLQDWIDEFDASVPTLPDEALRRENMYEDRI